MNASKHFLTFWRVTMKKLLLASAFTVGMALPAFAQMADDPSCTDFMAMDSSGQMKAVEAMAMATDAMATDPMATDAMATDDAMAADDAMASDDMMAEEVTVEGAMAACTDHPEMTVHDAMAAGAM
jgi:hypothetical protein